MKNKMRWLILGTASGFLPALMGCTDESKQDTLRFSEQARRQAEQQREQARAESQGALERGDLPPKQHREHAEALEQQAKVARERAAQHRVDPAAHRDERIMQIQRQLKELGFYKGPLNGEMTPETREAIGWFQRHERLAVTSRPDPGTLARLAERARG